MHVQASSIERNESGLKLVMSGVKCPRSVDVGSGVHVVELLDERSSATFLVVRAVKLVCLQRHHASVY